MAALEERLLADRARVRFWLEMQRRHEAAEAAGDAFPFAFRPPSIVKDRASAGSSGVAGWFARVAQSVEQGTENPRVGGSIPPPGTTSSELVHRPIRPKVWWAFVFLGANRRSIGAAVPEGAPAAGGTAGLVGATLQAGMKWSLPVAVALVACGAVSTTSVSSSPIITGDTCALHQDATSCRGDSQGCAWYANTRACYVGQPCPAGWCSRPQAADGGTGADGGVAASAGCACPGAGGDACVTEIGGPALPVQPSITCESIPASCSLSDRCGCLSSSSLGTCRASDQVTNLCVCDNGIR